MQFFRRHYKDIILALGWIGVLITVLQQDRLFGADLEVGRRVWLYMVAPIFVCLCGVLSWGKGQVYRFSRWDAVYGVVGIYLMVIFSTAPLPLPHLWAQAILLWTVAYALRVWLYENSLAKQLVLLSLSLLGAVEAVWAVMQLIGLASVNHFVFPMTGTFLNPGPLSGFLAMLLPLALDWSLRSYGYIRKLNLYSVVSSLHLSACLIMLVVLPAGFSRIAWLASLVGCGTVWVLRCRVYERVRAMAQHRPKVFVAVAVVTVLAVGVGSYVVYQFKRDSADGRTLIWKVSLSELKQDPIVFGKGVGSFGNRYGMAQHDYMKLRNPSEQEKRVADAPEFAFNEYLRIGVEQGLFGLIAFVILLIWLMNQSFRDRKSIGLSGGMISFNIFAFASYPLAQLPFWVVLIAFPALIHQPKGRTMAKNGKVLTALCLFLSLLSVATAWSRKGERGDYLSARNLSETVLLSKRADLLYHEPTVLFDYGKRLADRAEADSNQRKERLETALYFFEQGAARSCDPMFQIMIGRCYELLGDGQKAFVHYERGHYMIPNRLYPLYRLALLYNNPQSPVFSEEKARYYAQKLLETPVKITSPASKEMRDSARNIIKYERTNIELTNE